MAQLSSVGGMSRPGDAGERAAENAERGGRSPGAGSGSLVAVAARHTTALGTTGRPLAPDTRRSLEADHGVDLRHVRVHTGPVAQSAAAAVNARAFTFGHDIAFAADQYRPGTTSGANLLRHEIAHVAQQTVPPGRAAGVPTGELDERVSGLGLQRACGPAAIGAPVGCRGESSNPTGDTALFDVGCDEYLPGEEAKVQAFGDSMADDDAVVVHGFASEEGDATFNEHLSCARAHAAAATLTAGGVDASQIELVNHGATPGPPAARRSVVLERVPSVSRPVVPQLSATTIAGPTPGTCGAINWRVRWGLSRNSGPNGGFVVQRVDTTWNETDCAGTTVPDPQGLVSPLTFWEAWRVQPNSQTFSAATGSVDNYIWTNGLGPAGCTSDAVAIDGTAVYHDDVAALPGHMTPSNPATRAGILPSSTTDPALGEPRSRSVQHDLHFSWNCCPCQSSPTSVDRRVP